MESHNGLLSPAGVAGWGVGQHGTQQAPEELKQLVDHSAVCEHREANFR